MSGIEIFAIAFVVVGAFAQAITGIGFALLCGPFMVLCLGPHQGVIVTSALGLVLSLLVVVRGRADVNCRHAALLFLPACAVVPLAALIARNSSTATLSIVIGAMVLVGVAALASGFRWKRLKGPSGAAISGAISGIMGYLGGVGGPAVAMYAVNSEWSTRTLRPTLNAYFAGISVVYLFTRGTPSVGIGFGAALAVAMFAGFAAGGHLAARTRHDAVRKSILLLASLGGVAAIAKGII